MEEEVECARKELIEYARPLCKEMEETDLPPFRAINHEIPLIDVDKIYPWRPSRCPEAFRPQWIEKKNAYLKSGRWKITSARNTVPMMLIPKPGAKMDQVPDLRTVVEGVGIRLRFGEPGRPVTANGVSLNGENASRTRESRRR